MRTRIAIAVGFVTLLVPTAGQSAQAIASSGPAPVGTDLLGVTPVGQGVHEVAADGTGDRPLPGTDANSLAPVWSPDGNQVAYSEQGPTTGPDISNQTLVVASIDGSCHRIVPNPNQGVYDNIVWSHDGVMLAYEHFDRFSVQGGTSNQRVEVSAADGSGAHVVAPNAGRVAWAPDNSGRVLVTGDFGLELLDTVTGRTLILDKTSDAEFPAWSPDGTQVAYSISTQPALWTVRIDGTGKHALTTVEPAVHEDFFPSWSPDGTRIAFQRSGGVGADVWVINPDGTNPHPLTTSHRVGATTPLWSPEGDRVAYEEADAAQVPSVWTIRADGTSPHQVRADAHLDAFFRRAADVDHGGYRLVGAGGGVQGIGTRCGLGSPAAAFPLAGIAATGDHLGYFVGDAGGGVFAYGDALFKGSLGATHLNRPIVGIAATPDGGGYWLVAADGGVFAYGDARFKGSLGATHLNRPIVGIAATPDGGGYWLVAADGGVFAYGDARFKGSLGATHLNRPIVGIAATPDGGGYWLAAADGGVFAYGDARFKGSLGATHLNRPIVGIAATPDGDGYWLAAADGGVFTFGTGRFAGRGTPSEAGPIVGITT